MLTKFLLVNVLNRQRAAGAPWRTSCPRKWHRLTPATFLESAVMTIKILPNDKGNPPGKLADAELHFTEGVLEGLKLIGFAVWERKSGNGRNVTFPARQYSVNGERRSFALLRPTADAAAQDRIRDLVLEAYAAHEAAAVTT
jgi:hypothetical protein